MHTVANALVLRSVDYKETDCILTLLTDREGKITASARGCRKKNSVLASGCQLLCYSEMELYTRLDRWYVKAASPQRQFDAVRQDIEKLSLACYLAELTEQLAVEGETCPELLSLLLNALHALDRLDRPQELIQSAFELRAMCLAGFQPLLDGCGICGAPEPEKPLFHLLDGTLYCGGCRPSDPESVSLTPSVLTAMRYITCCDPRRLYSFRLPGEDLAALNRLTARYVRAQTERRYPTLDYYRRIRSMQEK